MSAKSGCIKSFNPKIVLIGAGMIGGTAGFLAGLRKLTTNVVLLDVVPGMPFGKALDLTHAFAAEGSLSAGVSASNDLSANSTALNGADVIIVTAGFPRKPGMSRDDLLKKNAEIIQGVGQAIKAQAPGAFVVCVTNPLDAMVALLRKSSGLPSSHVVGMAGVLDASRFKAFLAQALNVSQRDVHTLVMGGHGDQMVPLDEYTSVAGVPLQALIGCGAIQRSTVDEIIKRTQQGGGEIVELLGNGSAFVSPAVAAIQMVESYLRDEKRLLSCCAYLEGQYGKSNIYAGVPVVIGAGGVERIIELPLSAEKKKLFDSSVQCVEELVNAARGMGFDL